MWRLARIANKHIADAGQRPALPHSVEGAKSPLTSPASPYGQLLDVVSVIHSRRAVDLDLNLSILLKGSRGCGKQTTVSWIAQRMGMHLMEVSRAFSFYDGELRWMRQIVEDLLL